MCAVVPSSQDASLNRSADVYIYADAPLSRPGLVKQDKGRTHEFFFFFSPPPSLSGSSSSSSRYGLTEPVGANGRIKKKGGKVHTKRILGQKDSVLPNPPSSYCVCPLSVVRCSFVFLSTPSLLFLYLQPSLSHSLRAREYTAKIEVPLRLKGCLGVVTPRPRCY